MQVLVRNFNEYPYKEQFRDKLIEIPAGQAVEMEQSEAILFLGTFNPPSLDHDGKPTPEGYKKLKIEAIDGAKEVAPVKADIDPNVCLVCKYKAASAADLSEHSKANHADAVAPVDDEAEKYAAQKRKGKTA